MSSLALSLPCAPSLPSTRRPVRPRASERGTTPPRNISLEGLGVGRTPDDGGSLAHPSFEGDRGHEGPVLAPVPREDLGVEARSPPGALPLRRLVERRWDPLSSMNTPAAWRPSGPPAAAEAPFSPRRRAPWGYLGVFSSGQSRPEEEGPRSSDSSWPRRETFTPEASSNASRCAPRASGRVRSRAGPAATPGERGPLAGRRGGYKGEGSASPLSPLRRSQRSIEGGEVPKIKGHLLAGGIPRSTASAVPRASSPSNTLSCRVVSTRINLRATRYRVRDRAKGVFLRGPRLS
jgi:hypothetical protein